MPLPVTARAQNVLKRICNIMRRNPELVAFSRKSIFGLGAATEDELADMGYLARIDNNPGPDGRLQLTAKGLTAF